MGTLGYMSPEQVQGKPADAAVATSSPSARSSTRCSSGQRAFHGDSAAETMSAILREEPPDLSATNKTVPPGLERIVRHCLEKSPEERFHSAHDLAFDLEALSGTVGHAASPRPLEIDVSRSPRHGSPALSSAARWRPATSSTRRSQGRLRAAVLQPAHVSKRDAIWSARFGSDGKSS